MEKQMLKKCSVVNELERWKCYQDPNFSNQDTIKAGYPKPDYTHVNTDGFIYTSIILLSLMLLVVGLNAIFDKTRVKHV